MDSTDSSGGLPDTLSFRSVAPGHYATLETELWRGFLGATPSPRAPAPKRIADIPAYVIYDGTLPLPPSNSAVRQCD